MNAHFLEVLQFAVATIGLILSFWNLWIAVGDAIAMSRAGAANGASTIIAMRSVSREIVLLQANGILMVIGLISVLIEDAETAAAAHVFESSLHNVLMIALTVLLAADAFFERAARLKFDGVRSHREQSTGGLREWFNKPTSGKFFSQDKKVIK